MVISQNNNIYTIQKTRNAVPLLPKIDSTNGYITVYTTVEHNFIINDQVYIMCSGTTKPDFTIDNWLEFKDPYSPYVRGYKILSMKNNTLILDRRFDTLSGNTNLFSEHYIARVALSGTTINNGRIDGILMKQCNIINGINNNWTQGILLDCDVNYLKINDKYNFEEKTVVSSISPKNGDVLTSYNYNNGVYGLNYIKNTIITSSVVNNGRFYDSTINSIYNLNNGYYYNCHITRASLYDGYYKNCYIQPLHGVYANIYGGYYKDNISFYANWYDGKWDGGQFGPFDPSFAWRNGTFLSGTFSAATWSGGTFNDGLFSSATWSGGTFNNGTMINSVIKGYDIPSSSVFNGGTHNNNTFNLSVNTINNGTYTNCHFIGHGTNIINNGTFNNCNILAPGVTINNCTYNTGSFTNPTIYGGTFNNITLNSGKMYNGTFNNSVWKNGYWYNGTFNNGTWYTGSWYNGNFYNSTWYGNDKSTLDSNPTGILPIDVNSYWYNGISNYSTFYNVKWTTGTFNNGYFGKGYGNPISRVPGTISWSGGTFNNTSFGIQSGYTYSEYKNMSNWDLNLWTVNYSEGHGIIDYYILNSVSNNYVGAVMIIGKRYYLSFTKNIIPDSSGDIIIYSGAVQTGITGKDDDYSLYFTATDTYLKLVYVGSVNPSITLHNVKLYEETSPASYPRTGQWNNGVFNGGTFNGFWSCGTWYGGMWSGDGTPPYFVHELNELNNNF